MSKKSKQSQKSKSKSCDNKKGNFTPKSINRVCSGKTIKTNAQVGISDSNLRSKSKDQVKTSSNGLNSASGETNKAKQPAAVMSDTSRDKNKKSSSRFGRLRDKIWDTITRGSKENQNKSKDKMSMRSLDSMGKLKEAEVSNPKYSTAPSQDNMFGRRESKERQQSTSNYDSDDGYRVVPNKNHARKKSKESIDSKKAVPRKLSDYNDSSDDGGSGIKGETDNDTAPATSISPENQDKLGKKIRKIEATHGATAVLSESAIKTAGYVVERTRLFQSEYTQIFKAKNIKWHNLQLVVKMVNLTECSPRFRTNLLLNSVRIMKFASCTTDSDQSYKARPLAEIFIKVQDIFLVNGVKLFIFMNECDSNSSLYDMVKSNESIKPDNVRKWIKAIVNGIKELQSIGVSHRYLKLQHIVFDFAGNPKLCGWSKSVFFFDPEKKRILLQKKERRVRRNYHLPPEAFLSSYDPSKADIWSIGVMIVSMCTKRYPFNVRDDKTKFSDQWREFVKRHQMNTYVRNMCNQIFVIDPKKRLSPSQILKNHYFSVKLEKLIPLSCKADIELVREDSRVGGVSAIDLTTDDVVEAVKETVKETPLLKKMRSIVINEKKEKKMEKPKSTAKTSVLKTNYVSATDGGNVGEEENLPPEEQIDESQMAEMAAPEEAEGEAKPEEGEEAALEYNTGVEGAEYAE